MKTKLLFLDEDNRICRNFADSLRDNSYELVSVDSYEQAIQQIDQHGCQLLVFGAPRNESRWAVCQKILDERPNYPVVFILQNDCPIEQQIEMTAFRRVVRPFSQKGRFLSEVGKLVDLAKIVGSLDQQDNSAAQAVKPAFVSSLDFSQVISGFLSYLKNEFGASMALWARSDEWEKITKEPRAYTGYHGWNPDSAVCSSPVTNKDEQVKILSAIGMEREKASERGEVLTYGHGSEALVEVILKHPQSGEAMGHFLLKAPAGEEILDTGDQLLKKIQPYTQHFAFCLEYVDACGLSFKDDLTSLFNQRFMAVTIDREIERSKRNDEKFSVLFIDVDFFKIVNDSRGHLVGSKLLSEIASQIEGNIRSTDFAFRYGGDEFVVVLSGADQENATIVAERIRQLIEKTEFKFEGEEIRLTVSIGLATYPDHAQAREEMIRMADEAMYSGKHKSRNIVYIAS